MGQTTCEPIDYQVEYGKLRDKYFAMLRRDEEARKRLNIIRQLSDDYQFAVFAKELEELQEDKIALEKQNKHLLWQLDAVRDILTGKRKENDILKETDEIKCSPAHDAYFEALKVMDKANAKMPLHK